MSTIKGITISIGGETTGLQKALGDVNKKSKDIQSELKQVERLLKLDPKNTELLAMITSSTDGGSTGCGYMLVYAK